MKKIIASILAISILLVGYFVGQQIFDETPYGVNTPVQHSSRNGVRETLDPSHDNGMKSEIQHDVRVPEGCTYEECMSPPDPAVSKGNDLVFTGSIQVVVDNGTLQRKSEKLKSVLPPGSYVESRSSDLNNTTLAVRIPADKFDSSLEDIRKLGKVYNESIDSTDVTDSVSSNQAQLNYLNSTLIDLQEQLKTAKPENSTYIKEQIRYTNQQIENVKASQELVGSQMDLVTLSVTLTTKGSIAELNHQMLISKAWEQSAHALLVSLGGILVVSTALLPFLIIGFIIFFLVRSIIRKSKKNKENSAIEP